MIPVDLSKKTPEALRELFDMLYDAVLEYPAASLQGDAAFSQACDLLIRLCLSVNDYIHANNVLQCYKSRIQRPRAAWYHLHSMMVYGKRQPRYFMRHPERMIMKVNRALSSADADTVHRHLISLLMFYVKLVLHYDVLFLADVQHFTQYFIDNPLERFVSFNKGIEELSALLEGTIDFEDMTFDTSLRTVPAHPARTEPEVRPTAGLKKHGEPVLMIYEKDPKVVILGDLSVKKDIVYGLAKQIGFSRAQLEIHDDYEKIKTLNIHKYRHNPRYCGMIFGPLPHSSTGTGHASSLIAHVHQTEGYPYHVNGIANAQLKLTKHVLEKCLRDIHTHYETTRA
ncbi:MAG: hypothetical protein EA374_03065 [Acholeplasmatales bacterium]|nr:MAG: hypothetical protein EA374_03065 [Acholeplasmatales bacterium]